MTNNYRGVHLTAIFSKLAEKIIARDLLRHLHAGAFGPYQWAFTPGLSSRDLVTALVMSWVLALYTGFKVAGYLRDISGAFDRAVEDYLFIKFLVVNVRLCYLNFLESYLQIRRI